MADVLDAVRGLLPAIGAAAAAVDRDRRIDPAVIDDLADAGVFSMMTPTRFGVEETPLADQFAVVRAIAAQCASTGWVVANLSVNAWQVALFSEEAQEEVWGGGPAKLIASSYQPTGELRPQGDGYLLSGTWRNLSGCEVGEWAFLGALVLDDEGEPVEHGLALIRTDGLRMRPAAECVGLRGAASTDITLSEAPVPESHVYVAGRRGPGRARRNKSTQSSLYRQSLAVLYSSSLTMPLVGAADGAYAAVIAQLRGAAGSNAVGGRIDELDRVSLEIARAAAEIDQAAGRLDSTLAALRSGSGSSPDIQVRARRDQALATELAASAVDRIIKVGGRNALMTGSPIQRAWRDIHVGASHRVNDVERALSLFGRTELGHDVGDDLVFL